MPTISHPPVQNYELDHPSFEPGQQISIDGGIDSSRNIIAMILAIVLFIGVVIFYQFLENALARRERESHLSPRPRRHVKKERDQAGASVAKRLIRSFQNLFQKKAHPPSRTSAASSTGSLSALLKFHPHPNRRKQRGVIPFFIPCTPSARNDYRKEKKPKRRPPRDLLLSNRESAYYYNPRSPMDEKTEALLRSPDAFAEFQDPVRNLSFQRNDAEAQIRESRRMSPTTYNKPVFSIHRPPHVVVEPLVFRKKKNASEYGTTVIRAPDIRYIDDDYSTPSTPASVQELDPMSPLSDASHSQISSREAGLSAIEEMPESSQSSFFDHYDDGSDQILAIRKKHRPWFSLPSSVIRPTKWKDPDVFSIGSISESEEEHGSK